MGERLRLTFYGDDFTGSTDVLEALALAGVRAALFLEPPAPEMLARYPGIEAVGVAGTSRTMPPEEMEAQLPPVFERLMALGGDVFHYKTCSTFDSSPRVGSIGRVIELAQRIFAAPFVPLVVGAPALGRYCAFGNLFARSGSESEPYRLDRHPTMRHHPATPMRESDLRLHLARQTSKRVGLVDLLHLRGEAEALAHLGDVRSRGAEVVLFDVLTDDQLAIIGRLIWDSATAHPPLFACGSSGVEYALTAYWRRCGLRAAPVAHPQPRPVERIAVVSGSCSPVTDRQIAWAVECGFTEVAIEPSLLVDPAERVAEVERAGRLALGAAASGRGVVVHTCRGPRDSRIGRARRRIAAAATNGQGPKPEFARLLGDALGCVLRLVLESGEIRRAVIAGGDTASFAARALGIAALEVVAPIAPGSPLCRVDAPGSAADGLELACKGGQVGAIDFFGRALGGAAEVDR